MDHVAQVAALVVAGCLAAACVVVGLLRVRASARRRAALDVEVARSRAEVESLSRRVAELSDEVVRARRLADEDREYVITSLGDQQPGAQEPRVGVVARRPERPVMGPRHRPVGRILEDQLVEALRRPTDVPHVRTGVAHVAVVTLSVVHGVRRAFSPDVLDRAAAEAHVARRRSRRQRKREIREARRLVRAVAMHSEQHRPDQDVA